MKRTVVIILFLCMCINLCACKDTKETNEPTVTPSTSINTEATYEPEDSKAPENESSNDSEYFARFDLTEFGQLSVEYNNFIAIDSDLSSHLSVKTRSYEIERRQFERTKQKGKLEVEYPEFLGNDKKLQEVNEMIHTLVDKNILVEESDEIIDCYLEYEIKKATDDFISIVFTGNNNLRSAARTSDCEFTFNYDLKANKLIELDQITTIDIGFLEKSKGALATQVGLELYKAIIATNGDVNALLDGLKDENVLFYFEEDRMYVGFSINAVGFHTTFVWFDYR